MEQQTLVGLFEKQEHNFYAELSTMILPRDKEKLQIFMRDFFVNKVSVEEYKKELNMGEVAMLNSVLKMMPFPDIVPIIVVPVSTPDSGFFQFGSGISCGFFAFQKYRKEG